MSLSSLAGMNPLRDTSVGGGVDAGELADAPADLDPATLRIAGAVAYGLRRARGPAEVEQYLLRSLQEHGGASWAALYRPDGGAYRSSSLTEGDTNPLPERLETGLVDGLLEPGLGLRGCDGAEGGEVLAGARFRAGFRTEVDSRPLLLLIGPCDGPADPALLLRPVVEICGDALCGADLLERLRGEVFVDVVSGCYNRRAFEEHLTIELVRARRYERPLSLVLLDLDDFKLVNDTHGHPVGDYALRRVAEVLKSAFRTTDRVCRYGGDEFAVIFPETSKDDVLRLAERLRRQVAGIFPDGTNPHPVTASIGVAAYPLDAARPEDLVRAADRAMYHSKAHGRNRVTSA